MIKPKITIVTGHYGSGKTNLLINLAVQAAEAGERVTVADMDIVNPYFRSSDYEKLFNEKKIELIAPVSAGSTMDTPYLSAALYSIFTGDKHVFVDVGGDDAGAISLGRYSGEIAENGYEMIYVINQNRVLSRKPREAAELLYEIQAASRLKATALVNNTHLGVDTVPGTALNSINFAKEVETLTGLPLLYTTSPDFAPAKGTRVIKRYVLFPWEAAE